MPFPNSLKKLYSKFKNTILLSDLLIMMRKKIKCFNFEWMREIHSFINTEYCNILSFSYCLIDNECKFNNERIIVDIL